MNTFRDILLVVILMASLIPRVIAGGWPYNSPHYHQASNQQAGISQQEAITIAQQHIDGRVLTINRIDNIYRIKILSNQGSVHIVMINAIDGMVMPSR